jgi:hypothetical protein
MRKVLLALVATSFVLGCQGEDKSKAKTPPPATTGKQPEPGKAPDAGGDKGKAEAK